MSFLPPSPPALQAAETGAYKAALPWWKIVLLGMVAGCYVGLGGALLLTGAQPATHRASQPACLPACL